MQFLVEAIEMLDAAGYLCLQANRSHFVVQHGTDAVVAHASARLLRKLNSLGDLFNLIVSHVLFYCCQQLFCGCTRWIVRWCFFIYRHWYHWTYSCLFNTAVRRCLPGCQ